MGQSKLNKNEFPTVLGEDVYFKGKLDSSEELVVSGRVVGDVVVHNTLYISDNASVERRVQADNCSIQGARVQADVTIKENLTLLPGADVEGSVSTGTLQVESGALLSGTLTMGRPGKSGGKGAGESSRGNNEEKSPAGNRQQGRGNNSGSGGGAK